jgi:hypothetical protein
MNRNSHHAIFDHFRALCLIGLCVATSVHAQATFNVSFDATASALTPTERANITTSLQEAGRRWARLIAVNGTPSIEIEIGVAAIPTANGTSLASQSVGTINGRIVYEQGMAYELQSGLDPNGSGADVHINIGLNYLRNELWFDPNPALRTAPIPANRVDALSVFMHELGHALVYNGWSDVTTGVSPATYQSTFDYWTTPGAPSVFSGPLAIATWGTAPDLTTGNNKHWGNSGGRPAARSTPPAPVQWRDGKPVPQPMSTPPSAQAPDRSDLAPNAVKAGSLIDQLMNGVVYYYQTRYDISPLDIAVLADTGITLDSIFRNGFE